MVWLIDSTTCELISRRIVGVAQQREDKRHRLRSHRRTALPLRRHVLCRQVQTHHGLQLF